MRQSPERFAECAIWASTACNCRRVAAFYYGQTDSALRWRLCVKVRACGPRHVARTAANPAGVANRRTVVCAGGSPRFFLVARAERELRRRCSMDETEKQS